MLTDAHCHPFDLANIFSQAEDERRQLGVLAASSACGIEEFSYNEKLTHLAALDGAVPLLLCFGIHPQIFKIRNEKTVENKMLLETLDMLAGEKRIAAIGECGFDLYNAAFRETEKLQEQYFAAQIEIALKYDLPVVLHVRRAMHNIFSFSKELSKCKAVIFHSWPGTLEEAQALLRRGINAFFSFGNVLMLNHKQAQRSCALLPAQRLLTETDAPYQPQRGMSFSRWADLPLILEAAAVLRSEAGNKISAKELETQIEINFRNAFLHKF
jgi:TatD DNase family protein